MGTSTDTDGTTWTVPAVVNYVDSSFPFASEMNNPCTGVTYSSAALAIAALDGSDVVEVDADGEIITAYVFADNYFEMYINGIPVGKDNVPFTEFNSDIVRFKVNTPFTVAMKLVDWEENLGLGTENNAGFTHHAGDGGIAGTADDGLWYIGSNKDGTAISYTSPCSPDAATHEYTITIYALSATPASLPTAK